jgi:hypothetical protein
LAATIGIDDVSLWPVCDAGKLQELQVDRLERLIVAYAIPIPSMTSGGPADLPHDEKLDIVSLARETTFVTLLAGPATLTVRLRERLRNNRKWVFLNPKKFARARRLMKRLLPVYRDPEQLRNVYERWFKYTGSVSRRAEWVVDADARYELQGWFKRKESAPNRGSWIANAEAKYVLHDGAAWRAVLTAIGSGSSVTRNG